MRIRDYILEELNYEKELLNNINAKAGSYPKKVLSRSVNKAGRQCFYISEKRKRKYIRKGDEDLLRGIAYGKYLGNQVEMLQTNIEALECALSVISDYDSNSVIESLPVAYRCAVDYLKGLNESSDVIQSENPFHREDLIYKVSNGLYVRSKNELAICEMLISLGVRFRYEMRLELKKFIVDPDGSVYTEIVEKYPDFTIFLTDGTVIYWEHCGLMEKQTYRNDFFDRISLYYDNGIYPPKNLIVTMDGNGKPFDSMAIRKIIEDRILPYC